MDARMRLRDQRDEARREAARLREAFDIVQRERLQAIADRDEARARIAAALANYDNGDFGPASNAIHEVASALGWKAEP